MDDDRHRRVEQARRAAVAARLVRLTARERQVMDLVVTGISNKQIASRLGISKKTVEAHRAKVMEKMQAKSVVDLVRLALAAPAGTGRN